MSFANTESITAGFLLAVIIAVGIYDFWVGAFVGNGHTISSVMLKWSARWPIIPFVAGLIVGHLFFQQSNGGEPQPK